MKHLFSLIFLCFSLIVNGQIVVNSSDNNSDYYFSFGAIYLSNNINNYNDSNIVNDNGWNYKVFPKCGLGLFLALDLKKIIVNDVSTTNSYGLHFNIQYHYCLDIIKRESIGYSSSVLYLYYYLLQIAHLQIVFQKVVNSKFVILCEEIALILTFFS